MTETRRTGPTITAGPVLVGVVLCAAAGCGGGSSSVVRAPSTPPSSSTQVRSTPPPGPRTSASPNARQTIVVTPHTGLRDGQRVTVEAAGFSAGEPLQVIQCADKGNATASGDCNLSSMLTVAADASGKVHAHLSVVRGPFGANNVICSASQRCLVSVTQASLNPSEEADAPITFGHQ